MRKKSDLNEIGEMAYLVDEECDGKWGDAHAIGQSRGKVQGHKQGATARKDKVQGTLVARAKQDVAG